MHDSDSSTLSPIALEGHSSQRELLEMLLDARASVEERQRAGRDFGRGVETRERILRLVLAAIKDSELGSSGRRSPLEVAEQYADIFREAPGPSSFLRAGFRPLEVEAFRPQAEFNRALVEVFRQIKGSKNNEREWVRLRLSGLANPSAFKVKSHRENLAGRLVEVTKRSYLATVGPILKPLLDQQREWNELVITLMERLRLSEFTADEISTLDSRSSLTPPSGLGVMWQGALERQSRFNRHIVNMLRLEAGQPKPVVDPYDGWVKAREASRSETLKGALATATLPTFTVVLVPTARGAIDLNQTLDSVRAQVAVSPVAIAGPAPLIVGRAGIADLASFTPSTDFVVFVEVGTRLARHALAEFASSLSSQPHSDLLYGDEDRHSQGLRHSPFFKPDFSVELLSSSNFIGRPVAVRTSKVLGQALPTSQTDLYAMAWRLVEAHATFTHVAEVLSTQPGQLTTGDFLPAHGEDVLRAHFERLGVKAEVDSTRTRLRVRYAPVKRPLVSIVVPFKDKPDLLEQLLQSLSLTSYRDYEVLLISNNSRNPKTFEVMKKAETDRVRTFTWDHPFNYPAINNFGAQQAKGELVLFLNNDIEISESEWLTTLVGQLEQPGVGAVGPKLVFPSRAIQHAGVVLGMGGFAGHVFTGLADDGQMTAAGSADWARQCLALTSACLLMRKADFERLGGFDERFVVCGSDVDLCLKTHSAGLRVVYEPTTTLVHHESATRKGSAIPEGDFWQSLRAYHPYLGNDPFYSKHLSLTETTPTLRSPDARSALDEAIKAIAGIDPLEGSGVSGGRLAYARQVQNLANILDLTAEDRQRALAPNRLERQPGHVTWLLPSFGHPFGGVHTILRFADIWKRRAGVTNHFVIYDNPNITAREIESRVSVIYPESPGTFEVLKSGTAIAALPQTDLVIATLWTSAYFALKHPNAKARAYFVQDNEPEFYAAGSLSALAENTYSFDLFGIFNSSGLHDAVTSRTQMKGIWFEPSVDHALFHDTNRSVGGRPVRVFFYGRPSTDRNAFEIGLEALRRLKQTFGDAVEIVSAGEAWEPSWFGVEGIIENLGIWSYHETPSLYRSIDVGLCFMMTRHPSYLPLEMMACGVTVVTNENPANRWLFKHNENVLLAQPMVSSVVDQLAVAVSSSAVRERVGKAAAKRLRATTWDAQAEATFEKMTSLLVGGARAD